MAGRRFVNVQGREKPSVTQMLELEYLHTLGYNVYIYIYYYSRYMCVYIYIYG